MELALKAVRLVTEIFAREADTINDMGRRGATRIIDEASLETGAGSDALQHVGDRGEVAGSG